MIDASRAICIIVIRIHAEKQAYCSDNDLLERSKMRICQWPVVKQDQIGKMTAVDCLEEKKEKRLRKKIQRSKLRKYYACAFLIMRRDHLGQILSRKARAEMPQMSRRAPLRSINSI